MKGKILLFAAVIVAQAHAQQFTKVAPVPTGGLLWGVNFLTPNNGWVVGGAHECQHTTDGGKTWRKVFIDGYQDSPLYNITFVNPNLGFISGNSAIGSIDVFRTTDGGNSWSRIEGFPLGGSWYHHDFTSQTTGFMGSNGALVRTTDSGATFQLRSAYPDCPVMYGMDFLDANVGLVAGYQVSSGHGGIFKTTDGGLTWQWALDTASNDVVYLTDQIAIADAGTGIMRTTNGGATWQNTGGFITTGVTDIAKVDSNTLVGVSSAGDIWRTADGGFTWEQRKVGDGALPADWSVEFSDSLHGYVVGDSGTILVSSDGGLNWSRMNQGTGIDWNAIAQFDNGKVVLGGWHGYVQTSPDYGTHWNFKLLDPPTFGRDTSFSAISTVGNNFAVMAGHWGSFWKTFDGGENWFSMNWTLSVDYYANGVFFTDQNNGWICGWDYSTGPKKYVMRTRDGGFNWEVVNGANVPSLEIGFKGNNGWLMTSGQPFYRTTNGGTSWSMINLPLNSGIPPSCWDMDFADANTGYITGWDGYVVKTSNGGASWTQLLATQYDFSYLGVATNGPNEVWICGANRGGGGAKVKRSLNGGTSWTTFSLPGQYTTPYKLLITDRYVFAAGYAGEVWRIGRTQTKGDPVKIGR